MMKFDLGTKFFILSIVVLLRFNEFQPCDSVDVLKERSSIITDQILKNGSKRENGSNEFSSIIPQNQSTKLHNTLKVKKKKVSISEYSINVVARQLYGKACFSDDKIQDIKKLRTMPKEKFEGGLCEWDQLLRCILTNPQEEDERKEIHICLCVDLDDMRKESPDFIYDHSKNICIAKPYGRCSGFEPAIEIRMDVPYPSNMPCVANAECVKLKAPPSSVEVYQRHHHNICVCAKPYFPRNDACVKAESGINSHQFFGMFMIVLVFSMFFVVLVSQEEVRDAVLPLSFKIFHPTVESKTKEGIK